MPEDARIQIPIDPKSNITEMTEARRIDPPDRVQTVNHTWFRKNENRAGRWTSPDPQTSSASVGDPQSWKFICRESADELLRSERVEMGDISM
jgi:hypothetical protein